MTETGFVEVVQVVKSLADAFQSRKVFDYAFWFWRYRDASEVERQIVEVEEWEGFGYSNVIMQYDVKV